MVIDKYCDNAIEFAKTIEPDIKISWGINWIWAYGFKTSVGQMVLLLYPHKNY